MIVFIPILDLKLAPQDLLTRTLETLYSAQENKSFEE